VAPPADNGSYSVRAAGIFQADPTKFASRTPGSDDPGNRSFRGNFDTTDSSASTTTGLGLGRLGGDRQIRHQDYGLRTYFALMDPFKSGGLGTVTRSI
jgi:hypothetical protein